MRFACIPTKAKRLSKTFTGDDLDKAYHLLSRLSRNNLSSNGEPEYETISKEEGLATYGSWWNDSRPILNKKGFIERDHYEVGVKSYGYRLTKKLWTAELELYQYKSAEFLRKCDEQRKAYVEKKYTDRDFTLERDIKALSLPEDRLASIFFDISEAYKPNEVPRKKQRALADLKNILGGYHYPIKRSPSNGRLNHQLTASKKEIKKHLQLYGEDVAVLDIVNSQPFLAACVLQDEGVFMNDAVNGVLYEKLMKRTRRLRSAVKKGVMACLYRHEVTYKGRTLKPWENAKYKFRVILRAINQLYPTLMSKIDQERYSLGTHNGFALKMQRLESQIMIDGVLVKAQALRIPAIPIHDAMLVRMKDAPAMRELILNEYRLICSILPKVTVEEVNRSIAS